MDVTCGEAKGGNSQKGGQSAIGRRQSVEVQLFVRIARSSFVGVYVVTRSLV